MPRARMVARCSTGSPGAATSPAQAPTCWRQGRPRSRSRSGSGAVTIRASGLAAGVALGPVAAPGPLGPVDHRPPTRPGQPGTGSVPLHSSRLLWSAVVVLVVGDVLAPVRLGPLVTGSLGDGQMGHVVVGGGTVPVPLVGGRGDDVTGPDLLDGAAAGLHQPLAVGDVQGLADGVRMPGGAGRGGEPDGADPHP